MFYYVNLKLLYWKVVNLSCKDIKIQVESCKFTLKSF
jgi:hypothetical protein